MRLVDLNGKTKKIKSAKVILHDSVDAVSGDSISEEFLEVIIEGKNSNWKEWWAMKDFLKNNPNQQVIET